ncbi:MAG: hypothetical protein U0Y82_05640 [Thermoleophilia bacterium]
MSVHLAHYLGLLERAERDLAAAYRDVADEHRDEPDVAQQCHLLAAQCDDHAARIGPFLEGYGHGADREPDRLHTQLFTGTRSGGLGLLRDLHDLFLMATECDIAMVLIRQGALGARDRALVAVVDRSEGETAGQLRWLRTRMMAAAPQALVVAR